MDKLLQEELAAKRERFIRMKTRMAYLPFHKTLDQFDFGFQPSIDERRIRDLATLRFIEHQEKPASSDLNQQVTNRHKPVNSIAASSP